MISEETKQRIEQEARKHVHNLFPYGNFKTEEDYHGASYDDYIAGATAEAERVEELERENGALKAEIHKMAETLESLI